MECPYCGAELEWEDSYGNAEYIIYSNIKGKFGDIYKCPNHQGFKTPEDVLEFIDGNDDDLEEYCRYHGIFGWDEVICDSSMHNVSGSFYTDKQGNLHEGYPC